MMLTAPWHMLSMTKTNTKTKEKKLEKKEVFMYMGILGEDFPHHFISFFL